MLHCSIGVALVCVVGRDAGLDSAAAADAVHLDAKCAVAAVVVDVDVVDVDVVVVDDVDVVVVVDVVVGVVCAAVEMVAVGLVVAFVAPNQQPRKKIRTKQHSRYQMPMDEEIFYVII